MKRKLADPVDLNIVSLLGVKMELTVLNQSACIVIQIFIEDIQYKDKGTIFRDCSTFSQLPFRPASQLVTLMADLLGGQTRSELDISHSYM